MITLLETAIVRFLAANPGATGGQLRNEICLEQRLTTYNRIHPVLQKMQAEGLIHKKGNTSAARWYAGTDDSDRRNEAICRLRALAVDMRRTAAILDDFNPDNADQMRGASIMAESCANALKEGK